MEGGAKMEVKKNRKGKVYLLGAGPGDPELLTRKGERLLKGCEVVVYDRLISEELLNLVPENCEKIDVGKTPGGTLVYQEDINRILVRKAEEGKKIVRLKGGDPFVFGRGGEEIQALQRADIDFEMVPGISSALSAPGLGGVPVTHRNVSRSFHVITGHRDDGEKDLDFENLAKVEGTLVFLMGMENIRSITGGLIREGKDARTPAAVIASAASENQITVRGTMETIADIVESRGIKAPAVIVIGDTAAFQFLSGKKGALTGVRVGITGTAQFTGKLSSALKEEGAAVRDMGFLAVEANTKTLEFKELLLRLFEFNWLVFTSSNGVQIFLEAVKEHKIDFRRLAAFQIAVIGQGTGDALASYGFHADYVSDKGNSRDFAAEMAAFLKEEDRVLLLRAENATSDFTDIFSSKNIVFEDFPIYGLVPEEYKKIRIMKNLSELDYLVFGSSLGVETFYKELSEKNSDSLKARVVCIGEATRDRLVSQGIRDVLQAGRADIHSLVQTIVADYKEL